MVAFKNKKILYYLSYLILCNIYPFSIGISNIYYIYRPYAVIYRLISYVLIGYLIIVILILITGKLSIEIVFLKNLLFINASFMLWYLTLFIVLYKDSRIDYYTSNDNIDYLGRLHLISAFIMISIALVLISVLFIYLRRCTNDLTPKMNIRLLKLKKEDVFYLVNKWSQIILLYSFVISFVLILFWFAGYNPD